MKIYPAAAAGFKASEIEIGIKHLYFQEPPAAEWARSHFKMRKIKLTGERVSLARTVLTGERVSLARAVPPRA